MFNANLLEMTDEEINEMCEVAKFLSRPSIWKILRAQFLAPNEGKTREELMEITNLTNVTKDTNFLMENELICKDVRYDGMRFKIVNVEKYLEMGDNFKNLIIEFKNKRDYL